MRRTRNDLVWLLGISFFLAICSFLFSAMLGFAAEASDSILPLYVAYFIYPTGLFNLEIESYIKPLSLGWFSLIAQTAYYFIALNLIIGVKNLVQKP